MLQLICLEFSYVKCADYFAKFLAGKSNEVNQKVIQQRIRALQVFLEYIDGHPVLSKDDCYTKFLSDTPNWVLIMYMYGESSVFRSARI